MWVAYVNKWLGCDTWVCIHAHNLSATVERKFNFKTESHCLQNNHLHKCGCMTKLICQHTRTQILGCYLEIRSPVAKQTRERWTEANQEVLDPLQQKWEVRQFENAARYRKITVQTVTHNILVKFVHWPTFQQLQLIRESKPHQQLFVVVIVTIM